MPIYSTDRVGFVGGRTVFICFLLKIIGLTGLKGIRGLVVSSIFEEVSLKALSGKSLHLHAASSCVEGHVGVRIEEKKM